MSYCYINNDYSLKSLANITQSYQKNNKNNKKMTFFLKKHCLTPVFLSQKRYF